MADTSVQTEVERWVRSEWLPREYGFVFRRDEVRLSCGGHHSFGAVSEDGRIVASISTSSTITPGGKRGAGKLLKIRSDMYFMLLAENVDQRLILFTEPDMMELCEEERTRGKVPDSIRLRWVGITEELRERLEAARRVASREVTPRARPI